MSVIPGQLEKAQLENLSTDPSNLPEGRVWVNTTSDRAKVVVGGAVKEVVTPDQTQTLTNKTIDADANTITNIENDDIKAGAAIARSKLATGTTNRVVVNDGSTGAMVDAAAITASRALISDSNGIPTHSTVTSTELGLLSGLSGPVLTQTNTVSGITNKTLVNATLTTPTVDVPNFTEQASTPSTPSAGVKKLYAKTDGKVYTLDSTGLEKQVGAGAGSGSKNYLVDLFDGTSLTGINRYADAAAATPVDGTGGTPSITAAALNTTTPLRGTSSQRLSKPAANEQGEGWAIDFTLDRADFEGGRPVYISFRYKTSTNYVNNDVRVFVYDRDGAVLLNVLALNSDGSIGKSDDSTFYAGVFTPTPGNNDYRLIFHLASTNALAWDLDLIDLSVSPQSLVPGAIVQDLGTETWADNQANATTSVKVLRFGSTVRAIGRTTFTGAMSGGFTLTIPAAYAPSSRYDLPTNDRFELGQVTLRDTGTGFSFGRAVLVSSTAIDIFSGTTYSALSSTVPFTWANGDYINFDLSWEVSGWSATAALSTSEALLSSQRFFGFRSGAASLSHNSPTTVSIDATEIDNLAGLSSGRVTIRRTGPYWVSAQVSFQAATFTQIEARIVRNTSTVIAQGVINPDTATSGIMSVGVAPRLINLVQGDTIELVGVQLNGSSASRNIQTGATYTYLSVQNAPDFSLFSTYGQFELLQSTSSIKTPTGNNNYANMTGNSLTLTPGTWRLFGNVNFNNGGVTPSYTYGIVLWAGANGADSGTLPAALSGVSGLTILSAGLVSSNLEQTTSNFSIQAPEVIVRVTATATIFLVPWASLGTASNARFTVGLNAERLQ
jgi:hypothetical protein